MAFTKEKMAVLAPMPSASEATAMDVNAGLRSSMRSAYRKSFQSVSANVIIGPPHAG
jgi:hypothetical protein